MDAIFLDFDGVIIDSVKECFLVSRDLYQKRDRGKVSSRRHEELFYMYRGIAGPAWQIYLLHPAIALHLQKDPRDIPTLFHDFCDQLSEDEKVRIENAFFLIRKGYQKKEEDWFKLNPLAEYGESLKGRPLPVYHIVTTKNLNAVEMLLSHYDIRISSIYDVESYREFGSKGKLLQALMDEMRYQKAIFVDDSTNHLDTVKDPRVKCYFADWGYGENTNYPVFNKKLWNI